MVVEIKFNQLIAMPGVRNEDCFDDVTGMRVAVENDFPIDISRFNSHLKTLSYCLYSEFCSMGQT